MSKEVMKLALEAFLDLKDDCSGCEYEWNNDYPLQAKALKALEEALKYDMDTGRMIETVMEEL